MKDIASINDNDIKDKVKTNLCYVLLYYISSKLKDDFKEVSLSEILLNTELNIKNYL